MTTNHFKTLQVARDINTGNVHLTTIINANTRQLETMDITRDEQGRYRRLDANILKMEASGVDMSEAREELNEEIRELTTSNNQQG